MSASPVALRDDERHAMVQLLGLREIAVAQHTRRHRSNCATRSSAPDSRVLPRRGFRREGATLAPVGFRGLGDELRWYCAAATSREGLSKLTHLIVQLARQLVLVLC